MPYADVVVVNSFEAGGGAEVVYREMVDRYADGGCAVATLSGEPSGRPGHVRVPDRKGRASVSTLLSPVLALLVFWRLASLLHSRRPPVVVVHNLWPNVGIGGLAALAVCRRTIGLRCVLVAHDFQYSCATSMLHDFRRGIPCRACVGRRLKTAPLARRCDKGGAAASFAKAVRLLAAVGPLAPRRIFDAVVAPSATMGEVLAADGFPRERIEIVPNGLPAIPGSGSAKEPVVLFAGRLEPEKGADVLPDLAEALGRVAPGLRLSVCGDGSLARSIRDEIEARGLGGRVEFPGRVPRDEVLRRASAAKVFLFPSRWVENCPLSLAEAVACGAVPVVGEDCVAGIELLGRLGVRAVTSPVDAEGLARACAKAALMEPDPYAAGSVARIHDGGAAGRRADALVFGRIEPRPRPPVS